MADSTQTPFSRKRKLEVSGVNTNESPTEPAAKRANLRKEPTRDEISSFLRRNIVHPTDYLRRDTNFSLELFTKEYQALYDKMKTQSSFADPSANKWIEKFFCYETLITKFYGSDFVALLDIKEPSIVAAWRDLGAFLLEKVLPAIEEWTTGLTVLRDPNNLIPGTTAWGYDSKRKVMAIWARDIKFPLETLLEDTKKHFGNLDEDDMNVEEDRTYTDYDFLVNDADELIYKGRGALTFIEDHLEYSQKSVRWQERLTMVTQSSRNMGGRLVNLYLLAELSCNIWDALHMCLCAFIDTHLTYTMMDRKDISEEATSRRVLWLTMFSAFRTLPDRSDLSSYELRAAYSYMYTIEEQMDRPGGETSLVIAPALTNIERRRVRSGATAPWYKFKTVVPEVDVQAFLYMPSFDSEMADNSANSDSPAMLIDNQTLREIPSNPGLEALTRFLLNPLTDTDSPSPTGAHITKLVQLRLTTPVRLSEFANDCISKIAYEKLMKPKLVGPRNNKLMLSVPGEADPDVTLGSELMPDSFVRMVSPATAYNLIATHSGSGASAAASQLGDRDIMEMAMLVSDISSGRAKRTAQKRIGKRVDENYDVPSQYILNESQLAARTKYKEILNTDYAKAILGTKAILTKIIGLEQSYGVLTTSNVNTDDSAFIAITDIEKDNSTLLQRLLDLREKKEGENSVLNPRAVATDVAINKFTEHPFELLEFIALAHKAIVIGTSWASLFSNALVPTADDTNEGTRKNEIHKRVKTICIAIRMKLNAAISLLKTSKAVSNFAVLCSRKGDVEFMADLETLNLAPFLPVDTVENRSADVLEAKLQTQVDAQMMSSERSLIINEMSNAIQRLIKEALYVISSVYMCLEKMFHLLLCFEHALITHRQNKPNESALAEMKHIQLNFDNFFDESKAVDDNRWNKWYSKSSPDKRSEETLYLTTLNAVFATEKPAEKVRPILYPKDNSNSSYLMDGRTILEIVLSLLNPSLDLLSSGVQDLVAHEEYTKWTTLQTTIRLQQESVGKEHAITAGEMVGARLADKVKKRGILDDAFKQTYLRNLPRIITDWNPLDVYDAATGQFKERPRTQLATGAPNLAYIISLMNDVIIDRYQYRLIAIAYSFNQLSNYSTEMKGRNVDSMMAYMTNVSVSSIVSTILRQPQFISTLLNWMKGGNQNRTFYDYIRAIVKVLHNSATGVKPESATVYFKSMVKELKNAEHNRDISVYLNGSDRADVAVFLNRDVPVRYQGEYLEAIVNHENSIGSSINVVSSDFEIKNGHVRIREFKGLTIEKLQENSYVLDLEYWIQNSMVARVATATAFGIQSVINLRSLWIDGYIIGKWVAAQWNTVQLTNDLKDATLNRDPDAAYAEYNVANVKGKEEEVIRQSPRYMLRYFNRSSAISMTINSILVIASYSDLINIGSPGSIDVFGFLSTAFYTTAIPLFLTDAFTSRVSGRIPERIRKTELWTYLKVPFFAVSFKVIHDIWTAILETASGISALLTSSLPEAITTKAAEFTQTLIDFTTYAARSAGFDIKTAFNVKQTGDALKTIATASESAVDAARRIQFTTLMRSLLVDVATVAVSRLATWKAMPDWARKLCEITTVALRLSSGVLRVHSMWTIGQGLVLTTPLPAIAVSLCSILLIFGFIYFVLYRSPKLKRILSPVFGQ